MDLIPYSFAPLILFLVPYMLNLATSVIFIVCKWHWECRYFLTSCISKPYSEAIGLIIR